MPNLAGYDLVIEVPRSALEREVVNTPLETTADGIVVDTLNPPFLLARPIPVPGASATVTTIVRGLRLVAVPRTSSFTVHLDLDDLSIEAPGISVGALRGVADIVVPLRFTPPDATRTSQLVTDFAQATATLQLDDASNARLDAATGPVLAAAVRGALQVLPTLLIRGQGRKPLGFSVQVDPTRDSTNFMTLTALPDISWVDGETLAIFGYHRTGPKNGNTAWKTGGDLPPPPYPGFPWYPMAVILSPSSFQQLIACPAVRKTARDHVAGKLRGQYIDEERVHDNNQGPATAAETDAATKKLDSYLTATAKGSAEVDAVMPPPCGRGELDQRVPMPDPFSDTTAYIDWLGMSLGQGRIDIVAKAHAGVFCGEVKVSLPMWIKPSIGPKNTIVPGPVTKGEPDTDVDTSFLCKVATDVLLSFIVGPFAGSVATFVAFSLAESLVASLVNEKIVKQELPTPGIGNPGTIPKQVQLKSVEVAPTGLILRGVWDGVVNDPHKFEPKMALRAAYHSAASATVPPVEGLFEADCPPTGEEGTFEYRRLAWDTTVMLSIEAQDVPHPLVFEDWWISIAGTQFRLTAGTIEVPCEVSIPEPPDKDRSELREKIVVGVQGDNVTGWTLSFRGEDGNVRFGVQTKVIDGGGRGWTLWDDYLKAQGLTLDLPADYLGLRGRCAEAIAHIMDKYKLGRDVPRWDQVMAVETVVEQRLRDTVRGIGSGTTAAVREMLANEPHIAEKMFPGA